MDFVDISPPLELREYYLTEAGNFAEACYASTADEYARRGQKNKSKTIDDRRVGTYAEYAVWLYLRSKGYDVSEPDTNIYPKGQKSFSRDLIDRDGIEFHVKSCREPYEYPTSWLFQPYDPITIKTHDNEFMVLTIVNIEDWSVSAHISAAENFLGKYGHPKNPMLRKKVIYPPVGFDFPNKKREE
jgi:hypothetical protein